VDEGESPSVNEKYPGQSLLESNEVHMNAVLLVGVLALAALAGVAWYLPRARAQRRWLAVLDRYAEQEQARGTQPRTDSRR
jgi:hypothetical protein